MNTSQETRPDVYFGLRREGQMLRRVTLRTMLLTGFEEAFFVCLRQGGKFMSTPRIIIAGTHSGAGKTTISIGLMAALVRRGLRVQPYKVGPDYIDTAYHTLVAKRVSRNLDDWMLTPSTLRYLFLKNMSGADIAVIEGVMGLFDGIGAGIAGSTAAVAKTLDCPVILVVDASCLSASAAAQVLGYQQYDPQVQVRGVILNQVSPGPHYDAVREAVEKRTGVPVLGCLPPREELRLPSRHLGLVPAVEMEGMHARIEKLARLIETTVDIDRLLAIASSTPALWTPAYPALSPPENVFPVNLAVAWDEAFNFYYQDNLDLLAQLGASVVHFSPLHDKIIPEDADGVYLGGGFPEVFAEGLSENQSMLESFRQRLAEGLPCFAECGGLMYLTQSIQDGEGKEWPMTGVLDGISRMTDRLQRFGYVEIRLTSDSILGVAGRLVKGHEFHHSVVEGISLPHVYEVTAASSQNRWQCGFVYKNTLAGYPHLHFWSNPLLAESLVASCWKYKQIKNTG